MLKINKKIKLKTNTGITLIALVVTIIVLLILAGISISMLSGDNGLLNRAVQAKDATRGGDVQETVTLEAANNAGAEYLGGTKKTRDQVINELHSQGKLTDEEVAILEESNTITIGGITIDFSVLGSVGGTTLGSVYDSGDLKIGDKLTYSSNGQSSWIVFGKDTSGNILITTELPIDNAYNLVGSAQNWLTYETDLNNACSGYGETVQGVSVSSRSINMDDINYVAEFTKPTFDTYTFGSEQSYDNKKVNYYYPSSSASGNNYWQNPSTTAKTFENDWYYYYNSWSDGKYYYVYSGTDGDTSAENIINTENCQYIWGGNTEDTCYNPYLVASRSVRVISDYASFRVAYVRNGGVYSGGYYLCNSNASGGHDRGGIGSFGVRPVVVLPSGLQVEEVETGKYDLAH